MMIGNVGVPGTGAKLLALVALALGLACGRTAGVSHAAASAKGALASKTGDAAASAEITALAAAPWAVSGFRDDEGIERLPSDCNPNYR